MAVLLGYFTLDILALVVRLYYSFLADSIIGLYRINILIGKEERI